MANYEIMVDMGYKHELPQIEVSEEDKRKPESLLTAKEVTPYRGGFGSVGCLVDHCCPLLSFDLSGRCRRQDDCNHSGRSQTEQDDTISQLD